MQQNQPHFREGLAEYFQPRALSQFQLCILFYDLIHLFFLNLNLKKFKTGYFASRKVHPDATQVKPHTLVNNEWGFGPSKGNKDPKNPDNYR